MISRSFQMMQTVSATTKRTPAKVDGVISDPIVYLTDLEVLPLMPVSGDIALRYALKSPRESMVTYILDTYDILEGDVLVVAGVEYPIHAVGSWPAHEYLEIIVDKVIGT